MAAPLEGSQSWPRACSALRARAQRSREQDRVIEKPFDADKSMIDEIIAFPIAAFGFYWQVSHNFQIIFPFNIALLPLSLVEWFLRMQARARRSQYRPQIDLRSTCDGHMVAATMWQEHGGSSMEDNWSAAWR